MPSTERSKARSLAVRSPLGKDVYELYLEAESRPGITAELASLIGQSNVDILEAHIQVSKDKSAQMIFYLEMAESKIGVDELLERIRSMEFVREARVESKHIRFFENMMFPLKIDDDFRVFVLGIRSWAMLIHSTINRLGSAGRVVLHQAGVAAGKGAAEGVKERMGSQDARQLIDSGVDFFKASGYGLLEISGDIERFECVMREYLASKFDEPIVDPFIVGLVRGYIEQITNSNYIVEQLREEEKSIKFSLVRGMGDEFS